MKEARKMHEGKKPEEGKKGRAGRNGGRKDTFQYNIYTASKDSPVPNIQSVRIFQYKIFSL